MIRRIGAAIIAVCALSSSYAAEEELYLGASIGQLELGVDGASSDSGYLELIAGVQITEVASVEVSYMHLDGFENSVVDGNVVNLSLIGELGFGETRKFALLGRTFFRAIELRGAGSVRDTTLGFGVGLSMGLGDEGQKRVRLEYRTVDPGTSLDETYIQLGFVSYFQ